jgi:alpha-L-arabinofuranosidase
MGWAGAVAVLTIARLGASEATTVTIDGASPRVAVAPKLYGVTLDDVNHAIDGGLCREMLANGDFEASTLPAGLREDGPLLATAKGETLPKRLDGDLPGWSLVTMDDSVADMRLDDANPLSKQSPHSLRLRIERAGMRVALVNEGDGGLFVTPDTSYIVSFYLRSESNAPINVYLALEDDSRGRIYGHDVIENVGGPWRRYFTHMDSNGIGRRARLALSFDAPEAPVTIWLDQVSMKPLTSPEEIANGYLRKDLGSMLFGLKPAFVRFPGGLLADGATLDARFQWKNAIGSPLERRGTLNPWGYWHGNSFGFHEYLTLCDALQADAVYVCNAGIGKIPGRPDSAAETATPEQLSALVQEALDAIEYAIGPGKSTWGAKRAKGQNPKPFPLRCVEIGDQVGECPQYGAFYKRFYKEIHARYPQLTIVSDKKSIRGATVDVVDEQIHGDPDALFAANARYDGYDRKGPKVLVGGYSCDHGVGDGSMLGALSEAAFLMGVERNADVVSMVARSPLFGKIGASDWPAVAIAFDNADSVGRAAYWVQALFFANCPDRSLKTTLLPASPDGQRGQVFAQAGLDEKTKEIVIKLVNRATKPGQASIRLEGLPDVESQADTLTLASDDPSADNSMGNPLIVAPKESVMDGVGKRFDCALKPCSLTILRLKIKQ